MVRTQTFRMSARDLLLRPSSAPVRVFRGRRVANTSELLASVRVAEPSKLILVFDSGRELAVAMKDIASATREAHNYTKALSASAGRADDWTYLAHTSTRPLPASPCLYPKAFSPDLPSRVLLNHGRPLHTSHERLTPALAFHLGNAIMAMRKQDPEAVPLGYLIAPLEGQDKTVIIYKHDTYLLPCPPPVPILFFGKDPTALSANHIIDLAIEYVSEALSMFGKDFTAREGDAIFDSLLDAEE